MNCTGVVWHGQKCETFQLQSIKLSQCVVVTVFISFLLLWN